MENSSKYYILTVVSVPMPEITDFMRFHTEFLMKERNTFNWQVNSDCKYHSLRPNLAQWDVTNCVISTDNSDYFT